MTGQGFIFKCISLHIRKNIFACKNIFRLFRLSEIESVKLPYPRHDLIINTPCSREPLISLPEKVCSPICPEKIFLRKGIGPIFQGSTMPLLHRKIMWGYMFLKYLQVSRLKFINILDFKKNDDCMIKQVSSLRHYMILMLPFQTPLSIS